MRGRIICNKCGSGKLVAEDRKKCGNNNWLVYKQLNSLKCMDCEKEKE